MRVLPGRRRFAPLLAAVLLVAQVPAPATGDHGGRPIGSVLSCDRPVSPPRCTSVGNNIWHRVHFDASLDPGLAASLRDTMAEDYGATTLVMIEQPAITRATDAIAFSGDYGDNGAAGWVYCPRDAPQGINGHGHRWCQQQEIHFNLNPRFAIFFGDDASRDHVTCHELGHTLGLRHWGNPPQSEGPEAATCMTANTPDGATTLHQFDRDHIDDYYRPVAQDPHRMLAEAPTLPVGPAVAAWDGVSMDVTGTEWHHSLTGLAASADAVVRGELTALRPGRVFGPEGNRFHYASASVRVTEVIGGSVPSPTAPIVLEIPLFDGPEAIASLATSLTGSDGVFFLRSKGASARAAGLPRDTQLADAPFYRLVVPQAVIVNENGTAAVPSGDAAFLTSLDGRSFDEALRQVRSAARPPRG